MQKRYKKNTDMVLKTVDKINFFSYNKYKEIAEKYTDGKTGSNKDEKLP